MPNIKKIDQLSELAPHVGQLTSLGYEDLDQLEGVFRAAPQALAAYLGITSQSLATLMSQVAPPAPKPAGFQPPRVLPLGARLHGIKPPPFAMMRAPGLAAALPPKVSMIDQMRAIRNQGQRGTCVAHAATAAAEHYFLTQRQVSVDLSRQFLYWDCKQNDNDPTTPGTWISVAMKCLAADGCCPEEVWKYNPDIIAGNESQDPPAAGARNQAADFRIPSYRQLPPTSLPDIKAELAAGRCVAFTIPVYDSWYNQNAEVQRTGAITNPIPGEKTNEGHAMCFVGYEDAPGDTASGGGHFILRNSWNGYWATQSVVGVTGYGTIPYSYINAYCVEAYSIGA
ncbi:MULTISPECIES: C1 family peptidase [unclassified Caballeronia]|uniref:C1 family peptidase n=1 Tax=unclassified Caballeronia TaxID=2646786 RepID=UPI00285980A6|nr:MULTISPECIES: C1 family peptidase [unclassified Caballeronia]MDR5753018.1 C1 family peptidase [Caballeronia sp. LZ024]MDR5845084.1 C1 family peptidase [Caballeronia sp. LZ031]